MQWSFWQVLWKRPVTVEEMLVKIDLAETVIQCRLQNAELLVNTDVAHVVNFQSEIIDVKNKKINSLIAIKNLLAIN